MSSQDERDLEVFRAGFVAASLIAVLAVAEITLRAAAKGISAAAKGITELADTLVEDKT